MNKNKKLIVMILVLLGAVENIVICKWSDFLTPPPVVITATALWTSYWIDKIVKIKRMTLAHCNGIYGNYRESPADHRDFETRRLLRYFSNSTTEDRDSYIKNPYVRQRIYYPAIAAIIPPLCVGGTLFLHYTGYVNVPYL